MTNKLILNEVTKEFGEKQVIKPLSFSLEPNTTTALIGPNGSGKTTIMSMIAGLLTPTSGSINYNGQSDFREHIGFLPQYPSFFPYMSALEYIEMSAQLSNVPKQIIHKRSLEILEYVGLENDIHHKIDTFSGGMKQRLGIAQAIIHQPKLLLLDEPVSALDPIGRQEVMNLIKDLEKSMTILYSTHILNDAEHMTKRLIFLKEGSIVEQGSLEEIQKKYAAPKIIIQFENELEANHFATTNGYTALEKIVSIDLQTTTTTMKQILTILAQSSYQITKVEKSTASLEEIFMKVVN